MPRGDKTKGHFSATLISLARLSKSNMLITFSPFSNCTNQKIILCFSTPNKKNLKLEWFELYLEVKATNYTNLQFGPENHYNSGISGQINGFLVVTPLM